MIVNRDIKKYWEINTLLDILSGDFMSYVAKIVTLCLGTLCPGTFWPDTHFSIQRKSAFFYPIRSHTWYNKLMYKSSIFKKRSRDLPFCRATIVFRKVARATLIVNKSTPLMNQFFSYYFFFVFGIDNPGSIQFWFTKGCSICYVKINIFRIVLSCNPFK